VLGKLTGAREATGASDTDRGYRRAGVNFQFFPDADRSNKNIPLNGITDHTIPSAYSGVQVTTPYQPLAMALEIMPSMGVLSVLTDVLPIRPLPISGLDS